jgi:structural maintenance of chromosomes protein 5
MASLQVPPSHRRRRRVDEEDDEEQSTRATTPLSQSSNGSKRVRLDGPVDRSDDEEEDEDVDDDRNEGAQNLVQKVLRTGSRNQAEFQPGAIVRMKLKDFVTYTKVEYFFGPMLNMIIGPNGTGKSTLVCAICLGLGWGPQVSATTSILYYFFVFSLTVLFFCY